MSELAAFVESMPAVYRTTFDIDAMTAHQAIVARRGASATHVEIWRDLPERVSAICVVGDDKPGLLSGISAALVESRIDIVSAHAFCRTREDGAIEAVDFLWIRRLGGAKGNVTPIRAKDVEEIIAAISRATSGEIKITGSSERLRTLSPEHVPQASSARIRFESDTKDGTTILTVEAVDRPGLLLAVTQALFRAGLQIVGLRATTERGCAVDRFHLVESDGTSIRGDRLLSLQTAILGALDEGAFKASRSSLGQPAPYAART